MHHWHWRCRPVWRSVNGHACCVGGPHWGLKTESCTAEPGLSCWNKQETCTQPLSFYGHVRDIIQLPVSLHAVATIQISKLCCTTSVFWLSEAQIDFSVQRQCVFSLCLVCLRVFVYWSLSSKETLPAALVMALFIQPTSALDAQQPAGFGQSAFVFCPAAKHAVISSESPFFFPPDFMDWRMVKCFEIESWWLFDCASFGGILFCPCPG